MICLQSSLVALLQLSRVPILSSALMLPPSPLAFKTLVCRKVFICTPKHIFKWWMENVKHCTHLFLPLSYDVDWHREDLSLTDFVIFSLLSLRFCRPESSEFSLPLLQASFFKLTTDTWRCISFFLVSQQHQRIRDWNFTWKINSAQSWIYEHGGGGGSQNGWCSELPFNGF